MLESMYACDPHTHASSPTDVRRDVRVYQNGLSKRAPHCQSLRPLSRTGFIQQVAKKLLFNGYLQSLVQATERLPSSHQYYSRSRSYGPAPVTLPADRSIPLPSLTRGYSSTRAMELIAPEKGSCALYSRMLLNSRTAASSGVLPSLLLHGLAVGRGLATASSRLQAELLLELGQRVHEHEREHHVRGDADAVGGEACDRQRRVESPRRQRTVTRQHDPQTRCPSA